MIVLAIDGVWNARDVGGIPTAGGRVAAGRLMRSANLAGITSEGARELSAHVDHIVDLRADDEVAMEPSAVQGVETTHLPLFLGSVASFFEEDTSLDDLYTHLLEQSGARLVEALRIIARGGRTLVHCTVGKDRTGVTIALALDAVGADREAIIADYALTESQLPAERNRRITDYLRSQHPDAQHVVALATQSPAAVMRALLSSIDDQWGSTPDYLRAQGMTDAELAALRSALVDVDGGQG
ncbi:tyrosine-protein phosphatase [Microbacterium sp. NPDC056234]|uniref:tyrosine-protein phosphatase n=1 Tax=Microbacterium sp. NPDC056234 TaxID=3345757 RepID=UPI0035D6A6A1